MPHQNEYDSIAHLYDEYVQADIDLGFFRECARRCSGRILELMAGTGRVSKAIFEANTRLTCVDRSTNMLRRLESCFSGKMPRPDIICSDVRSLPLGSGYDMVLIPFNSFMELTTTDDQEQTLREIHRVLSEHGEFICTLHNPVVRARYLEGEERLLGRFPIAGDQEFELWVKGTLEQETGLAQSRQKFLIFDKGGSLVSEHVQEVRFMLIKEEKFSNYCGVFGFEIVRVFGNYDGSPYDPDNSPFLIWTLRKVQPE